LMPFRFVFGDSTIAPIFLPVYHWIDTWVLQQARACLSACLSAGLQ
jgi:hypothetical protein